MRSLGLSNYRPADYQELISFGPLAVAPVVNQIECNPFMYRRDCLDFFASQGIATVAYKPFLRGPGVEHPVVVAVAARHAGATAGAVLLKWLLAKGIAVLPKSTHPGRMAANLRCADEGQWALSGHDEAALDGVYDTAAGTATFDAHFAKRAVQDPEKTTIAMGYA